jgi:two-component system sensor histidine kinase SenX3
VLGDRDRLALALDALLENAVAHTDADGRIELTTHLEGTSVVLGVADSGCGIPAAELGRIFDRFARVDPHRNRKAGGVGLGLAIVKAIAEAHHGSVRAHSTVGQGSLFEVLLPQSTARRPGPGRRRRPAGPPSAHLEPEHTQPAATPNAQP